MRHLLFILSIFITACVSMPENVKEDSAKILTPHCFNMFTATGANTYQFSASHFRASDKLVLGVFAYTKDEMGNGSCAWAAMTELVDNFCLKGCSPSQAELEALAVKRCEALKPAGVEFKEPCKIFAINNKIVWENYKKLDEDFK